MGHQAEQSPEDIVQTINSVLQSNEAEREAFLDRAFPPMPSGNMEGSAYSAYQDSATPRSISSGQRVSGIYRTSRYEDPRLGGTEWVYSPLEVNWRAIFTKVRTSGTLAVHGLYKRLRTRLS